MVAKYRLLSNQIVGYFVNQYLWKESINILEFLNEGRHQGNVVSETPLLIQCGRRVQPHPNLPRLTSAAFGWSRKDDLIKNRSE